MKRLLPSLALLPILACAVESNDDLDGTHRVINGQPAEDTTAEYAATVGLRYKVSGNFFSPTPSCTGTLISEDTVLTAAHCLTEVKGFKVNPTKADAVRIMFGQDSTSDLWVAVSEVSVHPGYNPSSLENDIALARLAGPAPAGFEPVPALPASLGLTAADVGTDLDFVGFGYSNLSKTDIGVKLHNVLPLGALGCPTNVYPGCFPGAPTDTQFSYSQVDQGQVEGPCNGDSGGPAFIQRGGVSYVAGITSYGDGPCTDYGVSTTVDAFEGYINAFVGEGGTPGPDCSADGTCNDQCAPGDDPDCGGGDSGGGSCGDGVCGAGESCDGRNGTSACSDCGGKTNGKPSERWCEVEGICEGPGC